jgi:hypothetical protein
MHVETTTDWITAIGSSFAAVGTVGAVVVALWQVRRQEKRDIRVRCTRTFVDTNVESVEVISLRATNRGPRAVTLATVSLVGDNGIEASPPPFPQASDRMPTTELPITLTDGKSAEILWSISVLEELKVGWGCEAFLYAFFTDSLGNMYRAPFPGVKRKLKREGWHLRREYVVSAS